MKGLLLVPIILLAMMATALFTKKCAPYKANVFLALTCVSMAYVMFYAWLSNNRHGNMPAFMIHSDFIFFYLSFPCLFVYVALSTGHGSSFRIKHLVHLLSVVPGLFYYVYDRVYADTTVTKIIGSSSFTLAGLAVHLIGLTTLVYYMARSYRMILWYDKNIHAHHSLYVEQRQLYWLKTMLPLFMLPGLITFMFVAGIHLSSGVEKSTTLLLVLLFIYLSVSQNHNGILFYSEKKTDPPHSKYAHSNLSKEQQEKYARQLTQLMESKLLYQNSRLSMGTVAMKMGISHHALSQVVNQSFGMSFPDYIEKYRIGLAIKLIADPVSLNWKSDYLGKKCGFSSRTYFSTSFKKVTGETLVSYLQKNGRNADHNS